MRKRPELLAGIILSLITMLAAGGTAAADAVAPADTGLCQMPPHDSVAQLCADTAANIYGSFTTFVFPTVQHDTSSGSAGDVYDSTRFYTSDSQSTSYEFGLDVGWGSPTGATTYQPYWVDYTTGYEYHVIGNWSNQADGKNHTYMSYPHCSGCMSWDLYYDFNFVGTSHDGQNQNSHHLVTGWDLVTSSPGTVSFPLTSNRIQWLDGNYQFHRFSPGEISTRAPEGNCAPGADPNFCFHYDTAVVTDSAGAVSSWNVTKNIVSPGVAALAVTTPGGAADTVAAGGHRVFHGVDQSALNDCLASDPERCLATVPGLARCVQRHDSCNEAAMAELTSGPRAAATPMTQAEAEAAARRLLSADAAHTRVVTAQFAAAPGSSKALAAHPVTDRPVWVVDIDGPVREFTGGHHVHDRAHMVFDLASHHLLSACLGTSCQL